MLYFQTDKIIAYMYLLNRVSVFFYINGNVDASHASLVNIHLTHVLTTHCLRGVITTAEFKLYYLIHVL